MLLTYNIQSKGTSVQDLQEEPDSMTQCQAKASQGLDPQEEQLRCKPPSDTNPVVYTIYVRHPKGTSVPELEKEPDRTRFDDTAR